MIPKFSFSLYLGEKIRFIREYFPLPKFIWIIYRMSNPIETKNNSLRSGKIEPARPKNELSFPL